MADPLGISTGQGKGRAQVFGDTYNDYFAEKVKTGTEEKKVQQEELAKLQAADGLWDRDNELFKPKIEALRKYYRENARNIIKGDFDATTNLEAMKNDLTQFIGSSKESKEFYIDLKKKIASDPEKYSDATKARMDEYQRTGGRFDNDIAFASKYKASDTIYSLSDKVKSAGYDLDDITYEKDSSGKTYMIDKSGQKVDIDKMVDSVISAEDSFYGDNQVSEYWNQPGKKDQLKETLTSLMGEKRSTKYSPTEREPYSATKIKDQANRRKILTNNVKYNTKEALAELGNLKGQKNKDSGNTLTDIRILEPGERGALNRTLYVEYDDGSVDYMDVTDKGFDTEFNAFVSSTGESVIVSDDDLAQVPDAAIPKGYSIPKGKGAMLSNDLNNLMLGDDLDDRLDLFADRVLLSKSIFSKSLRSKIRDPLTTTGDVDKITGLLTDVFSGKNYKGGKIQKITYEDNLVDPDEYKVVYLDSKGKEQEVLIKATDKEGVAELSGMKKTKGTEVEVKEEAPKTKKESSDYSAIISAAKEKYPNFNGLTDNQILTELKKIREKQLEQTK